MHTSDSYGSTASVAFGLAASTYTVALPSEEEGEGSEAERASVEIART